MDTVYIFLIGFGASLIGVIVGSTSVISIPLLMLVGLPPHVAVASNKVGTLGMTVVGAIKYGRAGYIRSRYTWLLSGIAFAGSLIGSNLLLKVDALYLQYFVVGILFLIVPVMLSKRNIGVMNIQTTRVSKYVGFVLYFLCLIWAGFIGAGAGTIVFFIMMTLFGFTALEATATHKIPTLVMTLTSLSVFAIHGIIDYKAGLILMAGMATGGYFGAHIAIKKGNEWIKILFIVTVLLLALKMLS